MYYLCLALVIVAQTVVTIASGSKLVLNHTAVATLRHEKQELAQKKINLIATVAQANSLSSFSDTELVTYTPINKPIVIQTNYAVASNTP